MQRQANRVYVEGVARLRSQPGGEELAAQAEAEMADTAASTLYWVSRDMVDLATSAAETLPEWSPSAAIPEPIGLLAWAKPAGVFEWPVPGSAERVPMPVDAMAWRARDGQVGVSCAFRSDRLGGQLGPDIARLPLLSHPIGVWDLDEPVPHRLGDGRKSALSVLGAAWLLMSQVRFVETRTIRTGAPGGPAAATEGELAAAVSLIELRRPVRVGGDSDGDQGSRRKSDKRWWVAGHWRQQACGPKRALRKPVWISMHLKGDSEAEVSERVNVWRR
jgi:hypothetical protein